MVEPKTIYLNFIAETLKETLEEQLLKYPNLYVLVKNMEGHVDLCVSDQLDALINTDKARDKIYLCSDLRTSVPDDVYIMIFPLKLGAVLRQIDIALFGESAQKRTSIEIGPYLFKAHEKQLIHIKDQSKITLTDKEVDILTFLYHQRHHVTPRETLLAKVWQYNNRVSTHTLETHIYRLRQKIEKDPSKAQYLLTVEGQGYQLQV